jgi:RimJ/RimL family protein N-acetyltransferase
MENFATGKTKTREETAARVNKWAQRWEKRNPFSALRVFQKNMDHCMGHVILGYGEQPGEAELAGCGKKDFWKKGYGKEAARVLVQVYAPIIVKQGFLLDGKPLTKIVATAQPTNLASIRILEGLNMQLVAQEKKHGAVRNLYSIDLKAPQEQTSKKVANTWACTLL